MRAVCNEARLGREKFGGEVHTFAAAYREEEIQGGYSGIPTPSYSIRFISYEKYGKLAKKGGLEIGLRVNPGHAEVATEMYNPCAPCSRLGITHDVFAEEFPKYSRAWWTGSTFTRCASKIRMSLKES